MGGVVTEHIYYITSDSMSRKVQEFTKNPRYWTAYPIDTIETIAKHYNLIPQNARYCIFEEEHERLKFRVVEQAHGKPNWLYNTTRGFFSRVFRK